MYQKTLGYFLMALFGYSTNIGLYNNLSNKSVHLYEVLWLLIKCNTYGYATKSGAQKLRN